MCKPDIHCALLAQWTCVKRRESNGEKTSVSTQISGMSMYVCVYGASKMLKLCSEFLITATALIPMVIKQQELSRRFENNSVREF